MTINPFTYTAFADWIDKNRAPDRRFDYSDSAECACAQYARSLGIFNWMNTSEFWVGANAVASDGPSYFGPLSGRLREAAKNEEQFA